MDLEGEADVDVIMGRYFKTMRGLNATLESVYILMELGEEVVTMERKLLWGSESHINVLRKFDDLSSIHDARLAFVRRKAALLAAFQGEPNAQQSDAIGTRAKASIPRRLDYLVVRTTEEVMAMYQSIAKIDAARVLVCTNGSGIINFPATINLPSLTELKIKHTSGHLSGKLPGNLNLLWIEGIIVPSRKSTLSLSGMSVLQTLIVNSCDTLKLILSQLDKSVPIKVIISLCKPHKCLCEKHIRAAASLDLPYRVAIVPDKKYNAQVITENVAVQKNSFFNRIGTVYYKNSHQIKKFAKCELPDDIAELEVERKKVRSSAAEGSFF
uniref:FBD domain-containing protein n=1 Tax=Strongyloides papillosus TaxID=174720 RepID=A0A0N5BBN5_STREA